ncbi:hypothetical protein Glove_13g82 [Diversispora epigaea]|uniref:Uncharacterized protein n=1 Tax=Diversispora epigaea TaxID=1348612 RepID=A0A397JMU1_9GLOM|nr:hypothetical protein Glove_13g82 [Diversispora epigaea]
MCYMRGNFSLLEVTKVFVDHQQLLQMFAVVLNDPERLISHYFPQPIEFESQPNYDESIHVMALNYNF